MIFKPSEDLELRRRTDAEKHGSLYLNYINGSYGMYRLPCGCFRKVQHLDFKRGNPTCYFCHMVKLVKDVGAKGYEFVNKIQSASTEYRIIKCGHIQTNTYSNIMNNKHGFCRQCFNEDLLKNIERNNLSLVEDSDVVKKPNHFYCQCNYCGNKHHVALNSLQGNVNCTTCWNFRFNKQLAEEAAKFGITMKDLNERGSDRRTFTLECGCEKKICIQKARTGEFECAVCSQNRSTKPSKLYLIQMETSKFSWLKLGYGYDVSKRVKEYVVNQEFDFRHILEVDVDTGKLARSLESELHKRLKAFKIDKSLMKNYMKHGFSECYPVKLRDKIIEELNSLDPKLKEHNEQATS